MRRSLVALSLLAGGCSPLIGFLVRVTQSESGEIALGQSVSGSTQGASDDWTPECGASQGGGDRAYVFVPRQSGTYRVSVDAGYDSVVAVFDEQRASVACNDDSGSVDHSMVEPRLEAGRAYTIVVDGYQGRSGSYTVSLEAVSLDPLIELPEEGGLALGVRTEGATTGQPDTRTPPCGSMPGSPDQTWRFTAPETGRYTFHVDSDFDGVLALYAPNAGEPLACNDDSGSTRASELDAELVAGQVYEVVIDGYHGATGSYALTVSQAGSATPSAGVLALNAPTRGNTAEGTDAHAPGCGSAPGAPDQTWAFTPPGTGAYQLHVDAQFDSVLAIYEQGASAPIRCNDDFESTRQSRLIEQLQAGRTYAVVVDGYASGAGAYMLTATAIASSGGGPITLNRLVSGNSSAGPNVRTPTCGSAPGSPEETWTFVAPQTAMYRFHVDAEYDSVLALYDGGQEQSCNDDHGGTRASRIETTLNAGQTIEVVVDGFQGQQGAYRLQVTLLTGATPIPPVSPPVPPLPPIENITAMESRCASAPALVAGLSAGRIEASAAVARTTCGGGGAGGDAVYEIRVQQRSRVEVRAESILRPVLELRSACSRGHRVVACSSGTDDPNRVSVDGVLEPGTTYHLVVDTESAGDATFTLDTLITPAIAP